MPLNDSTIAWVWVSLAFASDGRPVEKQAIFEAADWINRAVLSDDEFSFSIKRLEKRGLVVQVGDRFSLTDRGWSTFERLRKKSSRALRLMELFEKQLMEDGDPGQDR